MFALRIVSFDQQFDIHTGLALTLATAPPNQFALAPAI
jgi:hypothetical protein